MQIESNRKIGDFYQINRRTAQKWMEEGMPHARKVVAGVSIPVIETNEVDEWIINTRSGDIMRRVLERRRRK